MAVSSSSSAAYSAAADRALAYLAPRVLDDAWAEKHDDVAFYFKAPLAFLESGARREDADRALARAARYADRGGEGSANGAYSGIFQHYPLMWICWAATSLGQEELATKCFDNLMKYADPETGAGVVCRPYSAAGADELEADLFATAEVLKVALLLKREEIANRAAATLCKALAANREHMAAGRFYLRWSIQAGAGADQDDMFHCIDSSSPGQLYFLLAFPVMALLERSTSTCAPGSPPSSEEARAAAVEMLEYLKGCSGVFESPMAHKVGRAAAMAGDAETARRIADFLLSLQTEQGCFQADPEAMDCVDQTAEIAVWLRQIDRDLGAGANVGGA